MKTPVSTTGQTSPGRVEHPPQPIHTREAPTLRRVSPLDRAALHLGIALITWGRRRSRQSLWPESRERRARGYERELARLTRERAAEREYRLRIPPR